MNGWSKLSEILTIFIRSLFKNRLKQKVGKILIKKILMRNFVLLLLLLYTFNLNAQNQNDSNEISTNSNLLVTVYKDYQSFVNDSGYIIGYLKNYTWQNFPQKISLIVENNDIVSEINIITYWGFKVHNRIFRVDKSYILKMVFDVGQLVYYETGFVYLDRIIKGKSYVAPRPLGYSLTMESEIITPKKAVKLYKKERPELEEICLCIHYTIKNANKDIITGDPEVRGVDYTDGNRECTLKSKVRLNNLPTE